MNTKEYNWEAYDSKVDFECKLKGHTPNFGYMSCSKRARFVQFLVKNGFLKYKATWQDLVDIANASAPKTQTLRPSTHYVTVYTVEHNFEYESVSGSGSPYRPTLAKVVKGETVVTDKSHRLMNMGTGNP